MKKQIIRVKFWIQRVMSYASVANFFMLGYLVLDKIGIKLSIVQAIIFIIGIIVVSILIGYLEDKLGLAEEEFSLNAEKMGLLKR